MSVIVATLLCDRKAASQLVAYPHVSKLKGVDGIYLSIETNNMTDHSLYQPLLDYISSTPGLPPTVIEWWSRSGWPGSAPEFDQDQRRLIYIVSARNMAIDYAMLYGADWLLFIDSDVIPEADGLQTLLAKDKKLCGGLVPGRGAHSHVKYIYNIQEETPEYYKCTHGTCGYMLIHKDIFSVLRFRWGPHIKERHVMLSEDPAYCADAIQILNLADGFYVYKNVKGLHQDDPEKPLTMKEEAQY